MSTRNERNASGPVWLRVHIAAEPQDDGSWRLHSLEHDIDVTVSDRPLRPTYRLSTGTEIVVHVRPEHQARANER